MALIIFKIATQAQADLVAEMIQAEFLKPGGVVASFIPGIMGCAQWMRAPLQWITIMGLENYGHHSLADTIARWLALNDKVYAATGKMMEKYNVEDINQLAGGGEYPGRMVLAGRTGYCLALKRFVGS